MPLPSTTPVTDALSAEIQIRERVQFHSPIWDRQFQNEYLAGLIEARNLAEREPLEYLLREIVVKSEATASNGRAAGLRSARLMLACAVASAIRATNANTETI
jgi:hypothetical protein